ncbi:type II toxin-antitoxin system HipA family toxin [Paraburkholderia antibiotica]|uniref:HipA domain-containing protein n=1 Tax=Paraburkholderia antibiotica TaxID=2728839 RepID=A0A7X9X8I5_9BURK|nr:HipA domain-containing protein [Paraburkholderia antibiotica]NML33467.1 HipA domain-containing protein [Paraburkholderia antibiotica]
MDCTLQIFLDDHWIDCAQIELNGALCQWNHLIEYAIDHPDAPVSLVEPVDLEIRATQSLPAFAYDLVPQGAGRRFLLGELELPDGPDADFPLICAGAFNPIGRIRVAEAVKYFDEHVERHADARGLPGMTIDEVVMRGPDFAERMFLHGMLGTGTTGVQGAAPKYLLTRDRAGLLHGDAVLPDANAVQHLIAKLPRGSSAADEKVLRNEAAYMRVAAELDVRTHPDLPTLHGDVLLIPRFDRIARDGKVIRLHQESVASILGLAGFDLRPSLFEVVAGIRKVVSDPAAETLEFIKRDVLNLAMRNTDNHARNTAVQLIEGRVQLTPLFDFAPMYLDPELIPRALRWYRPDTKAELTDWGDVLAALPIPDHERQMLAEALSRFAVQIERLPEIMAAQGVDHDIIEFLTQPIDTQVRQLQALKPLEA